MTREEAIKLLCVEKSVIVEVDGNKGAEKMLQAYDMAIEALQAIEHDGCEGCKYIHKDQYEMPCLMCKQSKQDLWEAKK